MKNLHPKRAIKNGHPKTACNAGKLIVDHENQLLTDPIIAQDGKNKLPATATITQNKRANLFIILSRKLDSISYNVKITTKQHERKHHEI